MSERPGEKGYVGEAGAQLHYRHWNTEAAAAGDPPLICLHPAPFSGLYFTMLAPLLATSREVLAPDYPGYGGSDPVRETPEIASYARAMLGFADSLGIDSIDVLGFHTGCLVGAEMALVAPQRVRRACLIDIPAYPPEAAARAVAVSGAPPDFDAEGAFLANAWSKSFAPRVSGQGAERAMAVFAEQWRPGPRKNAAFAAAFAYPWRERFALLDLPVQVIASNSSLRDGTREAAQVIPGARVEEFPEIERWVLENAAPQIAPAIDAFLATAG